MPARWLRDATEEAGRLAGARASKAPFDDRPGSSVANLGLWAIESPFGSVWSPSATKLGVAGQSAPGLDGAGGGIRVGCGRRRGPGASRLPRAARSALDAHAGSKAELATNSVVRLHSRGSALVDFGVSHDRGRWRPSRDTPAPISTHSTIPRNRVSRDRCHGGTNMYSARAGGRVRTLGAGGAGGQGSRRGRRRRGARVAGAGAGLELPASPALGSSCRRGRRSHEEDEYRRSDGRIDQIMAMQQQLADPSSALASSATSSRFRRSVAGRHNGQWVHELQRRPDLGARQPPTRRLRCPRRSEPPTRRPR